MTDHVYKWDYGKNQFGRPVYSLTTKGWPISVGGVVDYDPADPRWKVVKMFKYKDDSKWFNDLDLAKNYLISQWLLYKLVSQK